VSDLVAAYVILFVLVAIIVAIWTLDREGRS
jgi:hypothetical protein